MISISAIFATISGYKKTATLRSPSSFQYGFQVYVYKQHEEILRPKSQCVRRISNQIIILN